MLAVTPTGEIQGAAWNDLNGDGHWDSGEPLLSDVTVQLDVNGDGAWDQSTVTAGDGKYSFKDLAPGVYTLGEEVPDGFEQTSPLHYPGSGELTFQESIQDKTEGMTFATVSPDGMFLYAADGASDSITVFALQQPSGHLTYASMVQDGVDGVDGLEGVHHVTISPDGKHLYASGEWDDALVVFSRDETTGELTFVEMFQDGLNGMDGLDRTEWVTVSPDGKHVYATGRSDDALLVFGRDGSTGQLTLVERLTDGVNGIEGLDAARTVTVSPDGNHVYVTGVDDNALNVFNRDKSSGQLTLVETLRDDVDGIDGLALPQQVTVSPDGNHVYVAGWGDNALSVFDRDTSTGALSYVEIQQNGVDGVDGLNGAISVTVSPDGDYLYATGWWNDGVAVFGRDTSTGQLSFVEMIRNRVDAPGLDTARSVVVTPNGEHVYVAARRDDSLVTFVRDTSSGRLTFAEAQFFNASAPNSLEGVTSATVSPDSRHVYTTAADDDALSVFRRDPDTGKVTFVEAIKDGNHLGLDGAESVTVSPDGKHVYVAGFWDDAVNVFRRDEATGGLTFVEFHQDGVDGVDGLNAAQSIALSPDGDFVYVTGRDDDGLAVFGRNSETGQLTFVESIRDGADGVDGLAGIHSVTVSPDGHHLYTASLIDDAVAVFDRDKATGHLTYVEMLKDNVNGVDGLDQASSVALSADGRSAYVTGRSDDALAVFRRDLSTGRLEFVQIMRDGVAGVDGLAYATSVVVSPDGGSVFVGGYDDDAVAVFDRCIATGELTFAQIHRDGASGVKGLDGIWSVAVSPDGSSVYATGRGDDALVSFARDLGMPELGTHSVSVAPDQVTEAVNFGNREFLSLGLLDFQQLSELDLPAGDGWYRFSATQSGLLSLDGLVRDYDQWDNTSASATATVYDQNGNALATASSVAQLLRLDLPATQGMAYFLKVEGTSRNLDLRLLNLVSVAGTEITVSGTPNADDFAFASNDTFLITINDVDYEFEVAQYETIVFNGASGADKITITGGPDDEIARLFPDHGSFGGNGYLVTANDVTTIIAHGGGGADLAFLYDSPGDDQFVSRKGFGRLSGVGFDLVVHDFMYNYGYATTADGGTDIAHMEDTPEADKFKFDWPKPGQFFGKMYGGGQYYNRAKNFEHIDAVMTDGKNQVRLLDSEGDDTFFGQKGESRLTGVGFDVTVSGFDSLTAFASQGNDIARLEDSSDDDTTRARPHKIALWSGDYSDPTYLIMARKFDEYHFKGTHGGYDRAKLHDTLLDDHVAASDHTATLYRNQDGNLDLLYEVMSFEWVKLYGTPNSSQITNRNTLKREDPLDFTLLEDPVAPWEDVP